MNLIVKQEKHYGNVFTYPVCDTAKKLCSITPGKTFSSFDIKVLKQIGYKFIQEEVKL